MLRSTRCVIGGSRGIIARPSPRVKRIADGDCERKGRPTRRPPGHRVSLRGDECQGRGAQQSLSSSSASRSLYPMRQRRLQWTWKLAALALVAACLSGCDGGQDPVAVLAAAVVTGPAPFDAAFDLSYTVHPLDRPMTFELDFGDASPRQSGSEFDVTVHHTYPIAGTYEAVLSVTDDRGVMATDTVEITVDDSGPPIGILVGQMAPDFTAHTTNDSTVTLSTLRGSVVLLDFWGAWCPPCRASLPHLDSLLRTYGSRGLVGVIVSTDLQEQDAVDFLTAEELTRFTSVWEPGGKSGNPIAQLYGVSTNDVGIPRTYVIDRQGVIRYVGHPTDLTRDMIEAVL